MTRTRKSAKTVAETTRVVGYVRVSTAEQADSGLGLAAQRGAIAAECERRGWELAEVFCDSAVSGKSLAGRDGMAAALALVDAGAVSAIVVAKLDRLSRSLADFAGLMARAQAGGWNIVALDLGVDLSTAPGEFMASVMAAAAQWERRIIGQRTKDALAVRRAQGQQLGRPRTLTPEHPTVARIIEAHRAGAGWSDIARQLTADGVPTPRGGQQWWPSTVHDIYELNAGEVAA